MKERESPQAPTAEEIDDAPFLARWSRRKQAAAEQQALAGEPVTPPPQAEKPPLTDADMPPLESLDENSDYSGFFSPEVSEGLKQLALQKLFRSTVFNVCDGLDDYDDDYTKFEKLGDLMTADLRHRLQMEAERAAKRMQDEKAQPAETADGSSEAQPVGDEAELQQEEIAGKPSSGQEADS